MTERIALLTELRGLTEFLNRRAATLSTGQKQRVNLTRALIHDPPVVLLDEPTRGLDVVGSKRILLMSLLRITGGSIIDPRNEVDGEVRDLWIQNGRMVTPPTDPDVRADQTLDATGYVVMPGGIDMHCQIAGPKVNSGRKMVPELKRNQPVIRRTGTTHSGTIGPVPSTFATGYLYSQMGYTTVFDAAIPGLLARHAHEEFADTPQLNKGFYVLFGNNHYVMDRIREGQAEQLDAYCAWMLNFVKGYTIKIVNLGGVESWKQICRMSMQQRKRTPAPYGHTRPADMPARLGEGGACRRWSESAGRVACRQ